VDDQHGRSADSHLIRGRDENPYIVAVAIAPACLAADLAGGF
jgi:hypothetical protein